MNFIHHTNFLLDSSYRHYHITFQQQILVDENGNKKETYIFTEPKIKKALYLSHY
jgi:hypothetical protein